MHAGKCHPRFELGSRAPRLKNRLIEYVGRRLSTGITHLANALLRTPTRVIELDIKAERQSKHKY